MNVCIHATTFLYDHNLAREMNWPRDKPTVQEYLYYRIYIANILDIRICSVWLLREKSHRFIVRNLSK